MKLYYTLYFIINKCTYVKRSFCADKKKMVVMVMVIYAVEQHLPCHHADYNYKTNATNLSLEPKIGEDAPMKPLSIDWQFATAAAATMLLALFVCQEWS